MKLPSDSNLKKVAVVNQFIFPSSSERSSMREFESGLVFSCVCMSIYVYHSNLQKILCISIFGRKK